LRSCRCVRAVRLMQVDVACIDMHASDKGSYGPCATRSAVSPTACSEPIRSSADSGSRRIGISVDMGCSMESGFPTKKSRGPVDQLRSIVFSVLGSKACLLVLTICDSFSFPYSSQCYQIIFACKFISHAYCTDSSHVAKEHWLVQRRAL